MARGIGWLQGVETRVGVREGYVDLQQVPGHFCRGPVPGPVQRLWEGHVEGSETTKPHSQVGQPLVIPVWGKISIGLLLSQGILALFPGDLDEPS